MGAAVFDNQVFDSWLTQKSQEILSKVDRERISTEEMLILILKAQTNHFHHMDEEFRGDFTSIRSNIVAIKNETKAEFASIKSDIAAFKNETKAEFASMRNEFKEEIRSLRKEVLDLFKWQSGILFALFAGLYLKLFLG